MNKKERIEEIKNTMDKCFSELKKIFNESDTSFKDMTSIQNYLHLMNITDWEESLFN